MICYSLFDILPFEELHFHDLCFYLVYDFQLLVVLVFLHLTNADNPPAEIRDKAVFTFREQEGNTYVVDREVVERLGYQYEFPCRRVTLNIHSSLQAVGSTRLQSESDCQMISQVSWQLS